MNFKLQLLTAVLASLSLVTVRPVSALPMTLPFTGFNDTSRPTIQVDERGNLLDDLVDERGEPLINPRVMLQSRQNSGFNYATQKVRGVNLGGWLVAEPWITPSLFDNTGDNRVVDEYTFGQYASDPYGRLEKHWNTWITESDFAQIAAAGLNHVRIPIGYWAFDTGSGEPYVRANQFDILTQGVRWARNHGIKVIIDLHGAPGSQNGFDNSGRLGSINWPNDPNNRQRAKAVVQTIASRFSQPEFAGTVTSIELLNEPAGFTGAKVLDYTKEYYNDAYFAVRERFPTVAITIPDAFQDQSYWKGFMQPPRYQQVLLDRHIYSVFSPAENAMSQDQRLSYFCNQIGPLQASQQNLYTIVGEWTTAPTDCAKYLNGRGIGSRYDGTYGQGSYHIGSCADKTGTGENFSNEYKNYLRNMFETQISAYERSSGWVYWTWKTEEAADWDYQRGLRGGWITYNLNSRPNARC